MAIFTEEVKSGVLWSEKPVVLWQDDAGAVRGLVAPEAGRSLRAAESYSNFVGYKEAKTHGYVAAPPGWWSVWKLREGDGGGGWWVRVVAWVISDEGCELRAVEEPGYGGKSSVSEADLGVRFVYDGKRKVSGDGPWPFGDET